MKRKLKRIIVEIVLILITACLEIGLYTGIKKYQLGFVETEYLDFDILVFILLIAFFIAILLHIIVHELGHVVFGLFTGYTFLSFNILSFVMQKTDDGIKLKRYLIPGTLGQALMNAPEVKDGKKPYVLYNAGGVLFNLLFVVLSLGVNCICDQFFVRALFTMNIIVGMMMALDNIMPYSENGMNDGSNLWKLYSYPEKIDHFYMMLGLVGELSEGKEWSKIEVVNSYNVNQTEEVDSFLSPILMGKMNCAYEKRDFLEAQEYVDMIYDSRKKINKVYAYTIQAEKMFLELLGENRVDKIMEYDTNELKNFLKSAKHEVAFYRIRMAYEYFYKHDVEEAIACYKEGKRVAKKTPYEGDARLETGLLGYLVDRMEENE